LRAGVNRLNYRAAREFPSNKFIRTIDIFCRLSLRLAIAASWQFIFCHKRAQGTPAWFVPPTAWKRHALRAGHASPEWERPPCREFTVPLCQKGVAAPRGRGILLPAAAVRRSLLPDAQCGGRLGACARMIPLEFTRERIWYVQSHAEACTPTAALAHTCLKLMCSITLPLPPHKQQLRLVGMI